MAAGFDLHLDPAAINRIAHRAAAVCDDAAKRIAEQARANAAAHYPSSRRPGAIAAKTGQVDAEGPFADVGYTRSHPGFVLWWSEVGTSQMSPRPHLRQAVTQVRV